MGKGLVPISQMEVQESGKFWTIQVSDSFGFPVFTLFVSGLIVQIPGCALSKAEHNPKEKFRQLEMEQGSFNSAFSGIEASQLPGLCRTPPFISV